MEDEAGQWRNGQPAALRFSLIRGAVRIVMADGSEIMEMKTTLAQRKPSICIVSPNAYGAMTGGYKGHIGGVEWQTSLTAKWFAARGYPVSMITWDEGGPREEMIDGVRVIKLCRQDQGFTVLRFLYPRWTTLNRALRSADADLYYQNTAEYVTGQVALWCLFNKRKFIFSVASDSDVHPDLPVHRSCRERVLYKYGLRRANLVVTQTRSQQQMLRTHFGVNSVVLPMPCPGPNSEISFSRALPGAAFRILWIGRICAVKRLEWLLDIAQTCSDIQFDVVGPYDASAYAHTLFERASGMHNVVMHGMVARDQMPDYYRNASILCCTSRHEGFPNVFLEAWSHGVPIVSTQDPDQIINGRCLGVWAGDIGGLLDGIRRLAGNPDLWLEASRNARQYYLQNHMVEIAMPKFEDEFLKIFRSSGTHRRADMVSVPREDSISKPTCTETRT